MASDYPLIADIHFFALDDGPGIRSTVFFKGCPLSCVWCHNPEMTHVGPELAFYHNRCIQCGDCAKQCDNRAISLEIPDRVDRTKCTACGRCAEACAAAAVQLIGKRYSPNELCELLLRDRVLFETSGGGVTFSGGEPTLHMDYLHQVAGMLRQNNVHVALQTSGMFDWIEFERKLLRRLDLVCFDLKLIDPAKHRQYTGRSNERILENFRRLRSESTVELIPTILLIPRITATTENLTQIAELLLSVDCTNYELRPYHPGGIAKRRFVGRDATPELVEEPLGAEELNALENILHDKITSMSGK